MRLSPILSRPVIGQYPPGLFAQASPLQCNAFDSVTFTATPRIQFAPGTRLSRTARTVLTAVESFVSKDEPTIAEAEGLFQRLLKLYQGQPHTDLPYDPKAPEIHGYAFQLDRDIKLTWSTRNEKEGYFGNNIGQKWDIVDSKNKKTVRINFKEYNDWRGIDELKPFRLEISEKNQDGLTPRNYLLRRVYGGLISDDTQSAISHRLLFSKRTNTRGLYESISRDIQRDMQKNNHAYPKTMLHFVDFTQKRNDVFMLFLNRDYETSDALKYFCVLPMELASPANTMFFGRKASQFFMAQLLIRRDIDATFHNLQKKLDGLLNPEKGQYKWFVGKADTPKKMEALEILKEKHQRLSVLPPNVMSPQKIKLFQKSLKFIKKVNKETWLEVVQMFLKTTPEHILDMIGRRHMKTLIHLAQPHPGALFLTAEQGHQILDPNRRFV